MHKNADAKAWGLSTKYLNFPLLVEKVCTIHRIQLHFSKRWFISVGRQTMRWLLPNGLLRFNHLLRCCKDHIQETKPAIVLKTSPLEKHHSKHTEEPTAHLHVSAAERRPQLLQKSHFNAFAALGTSSLKEVCVTPLNPSVLK